MAFETLASSLVSAKISRDSGYMSKLRENRHCQNKQGNFPLTANAV